MSISFGMDDGSGGVWIKCKGMKHREDSQPDKSDCAGIKKIKG